MMRGNIIRKPNLYKNSALMLWFVGTSEHSLVKLYL